VQQVIRAVKSGDWSLVDGQPVAAGVTLQEGEFELKLVAADADHSAPLPGGEGVVVLDTTVTPELAAEGLARDVVRVVQQARREAQLDVSDRIAVTLAGAPEVTAAVEAHRDFVMREVLATALAFAPVVDGFAGEVGDGEQVTVAVATA
jgi:isoleucyl-tRNA synthetase